MTLCSSNPLTPAGPGAAAPAVCWVPAFFAVLLLLCPRTGHEVPARCHCRSSSATLTNPLCNFIHFKAPCYQLQPFLSHSINQSARERRKSTHFALAGQSWTARAKRCGAGGGSLYPPGRAKRCWQGTRGREQEHVTGEQARVAPKPRSSLASICGA